MEDGVAAQGVRRKLANVLQNQMQETALLVQVGSRVLASWVSFRHFERAGPRCVACRHVALGLCCCCALPTVSLIETPSACKGAPLTRTEHEHHHDDRHRSTSTQ